MQAVRAAIREILNNLANFNNKWIMYEKNNCFVYFGFINKQPEWSN